MAMTPQAGEEDRFTVDAADLVIEYADGTTQGSHDDYEELKRRLAELPADPEELGEVEALEAARYLLGQSEPL